MIPNFARERDFRQARFKRRRDQLILGATDFKVLLSHKHATEKRYHCATFS